MDWTELIGDRLPGRTVADRERRQLRRAGRAPPRRRPRLTTTSSWSRSGPGIGGGLVVDGRVQVGRAGLRRRDRPHGGRPGRAAVPVRAARLLGALRLGRRAGRAGPRGRAGRPAAARWCALAGGDPESVRGEDVSAAAAAGDPGARQVIERGRLVGRLRPGQPGLRARPGVLRARAAAWSSAGDLSSTSARARLRRAGRGRATAGPEAVIVPAALRRAGRCGGRARWRRVRAGSW